MRSSGWLETFSSRQIPPLHRRCTMKSLSQRRPFRHNASCCASFQMLAAVAIQTTFYHPSKRSTPTTIPNHPEDEAPSRIPHLEPMIEAVVERLEGAPGQLRRRWSDELKAQAVAEALEPGASVSAIAHRIGFIPLSSSPGVVTLGPMPPRSVRLAQGARCARLPRWSRFSLVTLSCAPAQTSTRCTCSG